MIFDQFEHDLVALVLAPMSVTIALWLRYGHRIRRCWDHRRRVNRLGRY